jgi:hypothetical protein
MSPPPSFYSSSTSTSRYLNNNKTNNKQSNLSESTHDYPLTPLTSPGHNSVTSQWVQKQQQQLKKKNGGYVHPMDFLQQGHDLVSEADTIDREVAAVTSTLALSSPRQSPYSKGTPSIHQQLQKPQEEHPVMDKKADRALEKLQTEVSALAEQIDRVRKNMKKREERDRQNKWSAVQLTKTLLKHVLANSAILLIIFYVLYKRKSPIAYAMMGYIMPLVQELMRNIIKRVVFWKVTV